jgi:translation initiation factor IF-3
MDYGKHKFDQLKKLKDQKKAQKVAKLKEMSLSMTIGEHDLKTKANQVSKFLQDGSKVKVKILMKGRQMSHPEQGVEIMLKFAEMLKEYGAIEKQPEVTGRNIFMCIVPTKK